MLLNLSTEDLLKFTNTLSTKEWTQFTEKDIADIGLFIATDGCSGVPDFYLNCCIIHDWFYRTHCDFHGNPVTKNYADGVLKQCIQSGSLFGRFSPMAWWRWWGVKQFGKKSWQG